MAEPKGLAAILAVGPKKPGGEEDGAGDTMTSIGQDLIDAVKAGDADGVASALRAAHEECAEGYADDEGEK